MNTKIPVLSSAPLVNGLETFVPKTGSLLVLCENQTGPYCLVEDYERMEGRLSAEIDNLKKLLRAWHLVGKLNLSRNGCLPDHAHLGLYQKTEDAIK